MLELCCIMLYYKVKRTKDVAYMGKTVLILGNGFDLAHGLPTRYSDFLNFCNIIYRIKYSIKHNVEYTLEEYNSVISAIYEKKAFSELFEPYYKILVHKERHFSKYDDNDLDKSIDIEYEILENIINKIYDLISSNIWYIYFSTLHNNKKK